jgi:hypothetical protein
MARWQYKINLGSVLEKYDLSRVEEDCPMEVKEAIAAEIAKAPPLVKFVEVVRRSKSIAALKRLLEGIYDEADETGVWCGIFGGPSDAGNDSRLNGIKT